MPRPSRRWARRAARTASTSIRFRNTTNGPRSEGLHPRLRIPGRRGGPDFNWSAPGFGAAYKKALLNAVTTLYLGGFGECLARARQLRRDRSERRRHVRHPGAPHQHELGENEDAMIDDMAATAAEMLEAAGAKERQPVDVHGSRAGLRHPRGGRRAHGQRPEDVGAEPVPADARRQEPVRHGRRRLPSSACQNPTLTIMALAVRSCDYLMDEMKRGVL